MSEIITKNKLNVHQKAGIKHFKLIPVNLDVELRQGVFIHAALLNKPMIGIYYLPTDRLFSGMTNKNRTSLLNQTKLHLGLGEN